MGCVGPPTTCGDGLVTPEVIPDSKARGPRWKMGSVYPVPETRATVKITPLKLVKTRGVPPAEVKATVQ